MKKITLQISNKLYWKRTNLNILDKKIETRILLLLMKNFIVDFSSKKKKKRVFFVVVCLVGGEGCSEYLPTI